MDTGTKDELKRFLDQWSEDASGCRQVFWELKSYIEQYPDITINFVARPGVTYSMRAARAGGKNRPLFALIDVIDENPRWLSVCFYEDMITDPEEYGDLVPEGLMGQDGYCFDIDSNDPGVVKYLCRRIDEAYEKAAI